MTILLYELCAADPGRRFSPHCWKVRIRIVLEGLRGEESIAELCRREGIVQSLNSSAAFA